MSRRADSQRALLAALKVRLGAAASIEGARRTPWASATFTGTRHRLECHIAGSDPSAAARIAADLPEMEFALPGHLVADIAVVASRADGDGVVLAIEALTIEEE